MEVAEYLILCLLWFAGAGTFICAILHVREESLRKEQSDD